MEKKIVSKQISEENRGGKKITPHDAIICSITTLLVDRKKTQHRGEISYH
jgi:hypothetical protein